MSPRIRGRSRCFVHQGGHAGGRAKKHEVFPCFWSIAISVAGAIIYPGIARMVLLRSMDHDNNLIRRHSRKGAAWFAVGTSVMS